MWANGDNLALLPWFVDEHLDFRKAVHVRIKDRTEKTFDLEFLDEAYGFDESARLIWLGCARNWVLNRNGQLAAFQAMPGPDENGDYVFSSDGRPAHWTAIDQETGEHLRPR